MTAIKHGQNMASGATKTYKAWAAMKTRCQKQTCREYPHYGGRGIKVCERWQVFENFFADMGTAPDGLSLDRKNNNGDYEPSNCRWATKEQQQNNMRSNVRIFAFGEIRTLTRWAKIKNIPYSTLRYRVSMGWSPEKALTP
jgi:hypothetical protein